MATITIGQTNIKAVAQQGLVAGGPKIDAIVIDPNAAAPPAATLTTPVATIDQAISSLAAANDPAKPSVALTTPDNFRFFDGTVNVSGVIPGDAFKGTTPGITSQFIDLTPDNIGIKGLTPNLLAATSTGNDAITAFGGRNILAGGSGIDTYVSGTPIITPAPTPTPATTPNLSVLPSKDTFLANLAGGKTDATIFNFHSGDDAALIGVTPTDFKLSFEDTVQGLVLTASPITPGHNGATLTLSGFSTADIGNKLTFGLNTSATTTYLFVHAT
jgi:hypothetical protein